MSTTASIIAVLLALAIIIGLWIGFAALAAYALSTTFLKGLVFLFILHTAVRGAQQVKG